MSKLDEAKPVAGGYDFGEDWLGELEEALDFDLGLSSDAPTSETPASEKTEFHEENLSDVEVTLDADETMPTSEFVAGGTTSEASSAEGTESGNRAVVAQVLDIAALQKSLVRQDVSKESAAGGGEGAKKPGHDGQLWQFVSLIVMRLFDDLELLVIQENSEEACDLVKQIHRLANILAFAGFGEQLPLLAYITNMLPTSYTEAEIGEPTERRYDALKMRSFVDRGGEFLNCLVYILTYLQQKSHALDIGRYTDILEKLYEKLGATPGQPSAEAPLPSMDSVNPQELTTRTINKLARTLEALVTESLHYLESAVFYGYSKGFSDACASIDSATQIAKEYHLDDLISVFKEIYLGLQHTRLPNLPADEVYASYYRVCDMLQRHFSRSISEKKFRHIRSLVSKFCEGKGSLADIPFCNRWKAFIQAALPKLELERSSGSDLRERVQSLSKLANEHSITWLSSAFSQLDALWDTYEYSCVEAFISLAGELRAFPTEDLEESDLEQLNHARLQILFSRPRDARPTSVYSVVHDARQLSETLLMQLESPATISPAGIHNLLIDARQVHCHALERVCEILVCLLERIPAQDGDAPVLVSESVVDALYFTAGLLQSICDRLVKYLGSSDLQQVMASANLFYNVLTSLYKTPGQPRDGVTSFIVRQVNHVLNELQLVWTNSSTSTSTEYYFSLIRRLLHIATMCKLGELRQQILLHMDDIPTADFVNTENLTMKRQCMRIIRTVEEVCPRVTVMPCSPQVRLFFAKAIAALNLLLSSRDADDAQYLNSEFSCLETRMSIIGMTTDFPPAIAFIFAFHHMAFMSNLTRAHVAGLLYHMISVANNVCPEWIDPKDADLEFVRTSIPLPMQLFQEMVESTQVLYDTLRTRATEDPVAWEKVNALYHGMNSLLGYLPYTLQTIVLNAQNRCRYLKKNIYIGLDTSGYPNEEEVAGHPVPPAVVAAFATIVDKLLEIVVGAAFLSTDNNSCIQIVLQPFSSEVSASIFHNGKLFTVAELTERLARVNIVPAKDDNLFDLLVGSRRLVVTYPPVNTLAYVLPLLRQFDGTLEMSDDQSGNTRLYLSFKL